MAFVHLRVHTEFSVVDGTLRIDDLVAAAARDGQGAVAITDLANLFGAVKLYSAARRAGVKPIVGADVWLEPDGGDRHASRLLLLVQTRAGYANLCTLLSRAWTDPQPRPQAWLKWSWLADCGDGLIALSGADLGAIGQALLARDKVRATLLAQRLAGLFPRRFYIELQRAGGATNEAHVRAAVPLSAELGLPVVATHPVQFQTPDDFGRTRRASAWPKARRSATRVASSASTPCSASRPRRRCRPALPTCRARWPTASRSPGAAT
jgi:DNA polymerase-3 subunit alpha